MSQGFPGNGSVIDLKLAQFAQAFRAEIQAALNQQAAWVRKGTADSLQQFDKRLGELNNIASALVATRKGGDGIDWERRTDRGIVRIEDIPGRRVPYTLLMDIPIGNNTTSAQSQSVTISQEGPFVAVKRQATFQSNLQFQVTTGNTTAIFAGRSFGRYRPIHSAWDIFDSHGQAGYDGSLMFFSILNTTNLSAPLSGTPAGTAPFPVITGAPPIVSAASSFRTMEFDGRIEVINAGSSYPRQNISVPSSMWSPQINAPQELGALDFFERGEVIQVKVTPNHVNNPPAGNADGNSMFNLGAAATPFPFENGQYDPHEGIVTQSGLAITNTAPRTVTGITTDSIQRLPDGIITIGWEGYRIIQPVGPV